MCTNITKQKASKKLKLYVSFLKELGLYKTYVESRKNCEYMKIFDDYVTSRTHSFSDFIDSTLCWADSGFEDIWFLANDKMMCVEDNDIKKYLSKNVENSQIERLKQVLKNVISKV